MEPKSSFKKFFAFSPKRKLSILFAQPIVIFLLPRTYWRIIKNVLIKNIKGGEITGFSPHMAFIFTYYLRIDESVKKYGRGGYVYEDALGFSLKERFWLNSTALRIFNRLRIKKFTIMIALIFLSSVLFIGINENISFFLLVILILLIVGSSLFLIPFFRLAKPEALSWAFFPLAFYTFFKGYYLSSALLGLLISLLNFTTTLFFIETIFFYSLFSANLTNGVLVLLFPLVKLLINFFPFLKRSFGKGIVEVLGGGRKVKSRSKSFLKLRPNDLYLGFFYFIFIGTFFITKAPLAYLVVLFVPLVVFFVNQMFFRFADNHTFYRLFFIIASTSLLIWFNPLTFFAYLTLLYVSSIGLLENIEDIIKHYPHLKPYSIKRANDFFENFFNKVESNSRILFEREDTEKEMAGFALILYYFEYIFLKRGIELPPMEYFRLTQTDYFMEEYVKINAKSGKEIIEEKFKELGGNYLLVYSEDFANNLKNWKYEKLGKISRKDFKKYFQGLEEELPEKELYLFRPPFTTSLIEPEVSLKKDPNYMEFNAESRKEYVIKYNYHPNWEAYQEGKRIETYRAKGKLSYIALRVEKQGKVELKFNSNWLN